MSESNVDADSLIRKFRDLTFYTGSEIFAVKPSIFFRSHPGREQWSKWRRRLDHFAFPLNDLMNGKAPDWDIFVWFAFLTGLMTWTFALYAILDHMRVSSGGSSSQTAAPVVPWYLIPSVVVLFLSGFSFIFAYLHAGSFLLLSQTRWYQRLIWLAVFCFYTAGGIYWILQINPVFYTNLAQFPIGPGLFAFWAVFLFIPFCIYLSSLSIFSVIFVVWAGFLIFKFLFRMNDPFVRQVPKLVQAVISSEGGDWKLLDLKASEIMALRDWSQANREGTDKRLLPTSIVLAVLAFIATTPMFQQWTLSWVIYFQVANAEYNDPKSIAPIASVLTMQLLIPLGILFALYLAVIYYAMFRNLVVQTYIIETCTVALYAAEQREAEEARVQAAAAEAAKMKGWRGVVRRVLGL
jgi:hypothetical protein